jgi:SAM-dependent methyltransferase
LKELFTLGDLYVSDFIEGDAQPRGGRVEMKMVWDSSRNAPRLEEITSPEFMYGKYWYRSGTNSTMTNELSGIVDSIKSNYKLSDNDVWLDIACNDGTLLSFVPKFCQRVGIDPVDDTFVAESSKHADVIVQDYFSAAAYKNRVLDKAKVVTIIAMFYDLENPEAFLEDVYSIMDNDGLLVIQMSYTPLMINQMAFDNICHEHLYYHSLESMRGIFSRSGFKLVDAQLNDINGGSFRIYAMKDVADEKKFGTQPYRDVCAARVDSLLEYEKANGYNTPEVWAPFYENLQALKQETYDFIVSEKAKGKKIWGYGASTKGNTLLQYFGLDNTLIDGIAERSPYKFGLKTVGTNIPITSEEEMRAAKPDYLLVLPWHFINEFVQREQEYLQSGGKFIVPCPKFEIIGA